MRFRHRELLLLVAEVGNPEERECPPLETATEKRLMKT
jgi:hypothetical protein